MAAITALVVIKELNTGSKMGETMVSGSFSHVCKHCALSFKPNLATLGIKGDILELVLSLMGTHCKGPFWKSIPVGRPFVGKMSASKGNWGSYLRRVTCCKEVFRV